MKTSFWTKLLDLFSPRLCVGCGNRLMPSEAVLCSDCLLHMPLTHFSQHAFDNPMARLFWGLFPVERAAALFFYEPNTQMANMIHAMKYYDRSDVAENMGVLVARSFMADGFFDGIDAIVPVPLSKDRLRQRGYNQSECIASGVSQVTRIPVCKKVLGRKTFAGSQTHLSVYQRRENVEQAFHLQDAVSLSGHHLLLVDDVVTTGSTIAACGRLLQQIPDVRISVLALGLSKS